MNSNTTLLRHKLSMLDCKFDSNKELVKEVKLYNNYQMRISIRIKKLYEDPEDFIANVNMRRYLLERDELMGIKHSWWYHFKHWIKGL